MKRLLSVFTIFFFSIFSVISSYASLRTPSNAVQVVPYSSLGTVTNTIDLSGVRFFVYYDDHSLGISNILRYGSASVSDNRLSFSITLDTDQVITSWGFQLFPDNLPDPGTYEFSFDLASDFTYTLSDMDIYSRKDPRNTGSQTSYFTLDYQQFAGDVYIPAYTFTLTNLAYLNVNGYVDSESNLHNMGGSCAFCFFVVGSDPDAPSTAGTNTSQQDWENNVSSSLGDISSSLSSVDESLEYISQSQNLIIQGIDNVILHISDQLYAFWDQLYNLIHVPTMAKLDDIINAINNLKLDVTVDLDELLDTLNQNHEDQIANDNAIADQIQNGYDDSSLVSDNERLDQVINEYDDVETELFDDSKDYISGFDFEDGLDQYLGPLQDISGFLGGIYTTLAGLNIPIGFSLTLTIALLFIGYYRFKGGG